MAEGLELFERMLGECGQRITITYSAAISACEKGRPRPQALQLFKRIRSESVLRDTITYNAAINASEKGEWDAAINACEKTRNDSRNCSSSKE